MFLLREHDYSILLYSIFSPMQGIFLVNAIFFEKIF